MGLCGCWEIVEKKNPIHFCTKDDKTAMAMERRRIGVGSASLVVIGFS